MLLFSRNIKHPTHVRIQLHIGGLLGALNFMIPSSNKLAVIIMNGTDLSDGWEGFRFRVAIARGTLHRWSWRPSPPDGGRDAPTHIRNHSTSGSTKGLLSHVWTFYKYCTIWYKISHRTPPPLVLLFCLVSALQHHLPHANKFSLSEGRRGALPGAGGERESDGLRPQERKAAARGQGVRPPKG